MVVRLTKHIRADEPEPEPGVQDFGLQMWEAQPSRPFGRKELDALLTFKWQYYPWRKIIKTYQGKYIHVNLLALFPLSSTGEHGN